MLLEVKQMLRFRLRFSEPANQNMSPASPSSSHVETQIPDAGAEYLTRTMALAPRMSVRKQISSEDQLELRALLSQRLQVICLAMLIVSGIDVLNSTLGSLLQPQALSAFSMPSIGATAAAVCIY